MVAARFFQIRAFQRVIPVKKEKIKLFPRLTSGTRTRLLNLEVPHESVLLLDLSQVRHGHLPCRGGRHIGGRCPGKGHRPGVGRGRIGPGGPTPHRPRGRADERFCHQKRSTRVWVAGGRGENNCKFSRPVCYHQQGLLPRCRRLQQLRRRRAALRTERLERARKRAHAGRAHAGDQVRARADAGRCLNECRLYAVDRRATDLRLSAANNLNLGVFSM